MADKIQVDLKFIILIIALIIIAAVGSAYTTFLVFSQSETPAAGEEKNEEETAKSEEFGPILEVGEFTVNLMTPQGLPSRYIRTGLVLQVADRKVAAELKRREPQVRDAVIGVLRTKTIEEISGKTGMHHLRQEIKTAVSHLLSPGAVTDVYFTDFVIQ